MAKRDYTIKLLTYVSERIISGLPLILSNSITATAYARANGLDKRSVLNAVRMGTIQTHPYIYNANLNLHKSFAALDSDVQVNFGGKIGKGLVILIRAEVIL